MLAIPGAGVAAEAAAVEEVAAVHGPWKAQAGSRPPVPFVHGDRKQALRFQAALSRDSGWRVYWDLDLKADWSREEQILITLRATDAGAVAQGTLYVRSGTGWYRLAPFTVDRDWSVAVLNKAQAVAEGTPTGWHAVDGLRLAFSPAAKRDTAIDLASLGTRRHLPDAHLGAVGGHPGLDQVAAAFRAAAQGPSQRAEVDVRLLQAQALSAQAAQAGGGPTRKALILQGRERVAQAYALVQTPRDGEFRALWVHHGDGPRAQGGNRVKRWKQALPEMKAQGYNAVLPNVLWSGVAFYPSQIVPTHAGVAQEGDYLKEIIDAAQPLGMQVHAWKVMWQFGEGWLAPTGVSQPFRAAGRLQLDAQGRELPWLCPCDERNRQYELAAIKELAANYAVDGIHLDYLRWDGDQGSFTPMCRERFEAWSKTRVANWPRDVLATGSRHAQWQDFKRHVMTSFLRQTRLALNQLKPGLQLSAAVFPDPLQARNAVFQDWPSWVKEGLVDWISTMTYNEDAAGFKSALLRQTALMVNPAVKLYPGMQFTLGGAQTLALESAVDQIKAVRELGLPGFVVFEWRDHLLDGLAPYLRAGLLREGPYAPVSLHQRPAPPPMKLAAGDRGRPLGLRPGNGGSLLLDDFEGVPLLNLARGLWGLEVDPHGLGTTAGPLPLRLQPGGARGSRFSLGFKGHLGKSVAPWPYAVLHAALNAERAPVDLGPFKGITFYARGDGKPYEVVLRQRVVKDYGYFRATFRVGSEWQRVDLDWKDFSQPAWAQPVARGFVDVDRIDFSPWGISDSNFELWIDEVSFRP